MTAHIFATRRGKLHSFRMERACYDKMERESMEYFYMAEEEIQRQRERIRVLENILKASGISIPEED